MKTSIVSRVRCALVVAHLQGLAGCAGVSSPAQPVPPALAPAAHEALAMTVVADGVQIYACRAGASPTWALVAPEAELFDARGRHVGHHGAGPHWQADDGSRIDGRVVSRVAAPTADAIPWLLLSAQASGPRGSFSRVTSVQRVDTVGGVAPPTPCDRDRDGSVVRVPYRAAYRLFVDRSAAQSSYAPY